MRKILPLLPLRCLMAACFLGALPLRDAGAQSEPAKLYRMDLVAVFGTRPLQFRFVVSFPLERMFIVESMETLKQFVDTIPRGATLQWAPSDMRMPNEPPVFASPDEETAFEAYCRERGVRFVHVPAG
ncbi:MAG: hypothetical protein V4710_22365 [Verrucomicrobiota bacterium]